MSKQFLAVLAAVIIVLGGIFYFTNHKASAPGSGSNNNSNVKGQLTEHIEGQGKKGVTLIEYGDYQCPACYEYYQPLKQIVAKYDKDIYFQFRNFPLTQLHQNAFAAARAAEAAGLQGKYWQMHDLLYQNQQAWSDSPNALSFFTSYARQLGLNIDKFSSDYASAKVNADINTDADAGNKIGATGTPTFVLDGKKISSPAPTVQAFSQVLNAEIANKSNSKQ